MSVDWPADSSSEYGWHWLQYAAAPVATRPEVWKRNAMGGWTRIGMLNSKSARQLQSEGWVYVAPIAEPAA